MENILLTEDTTPKEDETVNVEAAVEPNNPLEGVEIEAREERNNRKSDPVTDEAQSIDATLIASCPPLVSLNQPNRSRGRPRGSMNKPKYPYGGGPIGVEFTAHPLFIQAGEDLYDRIMCACRVTPAMTILACNGTISRATISPNRNYGTITLTSQGPFEIVSLKGTDAVNLSVSLSDTRGQLYGGRVAGPMIAATPLQLIIGCYNQVSVKEHKRSRKSRPKSPRAAGTQEDAQVVSNPEAVTVALMESTAVGGEGAGFNNQAGLPEAGNANIGSPLDLVDIAPSDFV